MSNEYRGGVDLDSVFRLAKMTGLSTRAVSTSAADRGLPALYGSWFDEARIEDPIAGVPSGDLVLIHVGYPDEAAHSHGAASLEYAQAVARSDARRSGGSRGRSIPHATRSG
jgi:hypothetical protein